MENKNKIRKKWQNIFMNILAIFFLLSILILFLKVKFYIYFKLDNLTTCLKIKYRFIEINQKGIWIKKKKIYSFNNKRI